MDTALKFYRDLVGWTYEDNPTTNHPYKIIRCGGRQIGGIMQMDENWGDIPAHWMVYFSVENIDQSVEKLMDFGGKVCVPTFEIPVGRMSVVSDPEGGTFTLIQLDPKPTM
jgi:predicted enzyme related to lactoylglutathione lyase